jgi:hypothetical protein
MLQDYSDVHNFLNWSSIYFWGFPRLSVLWYYIDMSYDDFVTLFSFIRFTCCFWCNWYFFIISVIFSVCRRSLILKKFGVLFHKVAPCSDLRNLAWCRFYSLSSFLADGFVLCKTTWFLTKSPFIIKPFPIWEYNTITVEAVLFSSHHH